MTGAPSPVQNRLLGIGLVVLIVVFVHFVQLLGTTLARKIMRR